MVLFIKYYNFRRMRGVGHTPQMGDMRNKYVVLVGNPDGRRPFGKPRFRWEDNIKVDIKETG